MKTIAIVGAGQAGSQAAQSLRQAGYDGRIALIGDEPHPPYQRPPLSKKYLVGEVDRDRIQLQPDRFFADNAIDCLFGTAVDHIDPDRQRLIFEDGAHLTFDRLLIASGSRCRPLPIPGADHPAVHSIRKISDVDGLAPDLVSGRRLIIIGGGYIGLEVAAMARRAGLDVRILEASDRIMARTSAPIVSDHFMRLHQSHGVAIDIGVTIEHLETSEHGVVVQTSDQAHEADLVLVGIGGIANQEIAAAAGLATANGIVVDTMCRTSAPTIFAAGDCCTFPSAKYGRRIRLESVQNAIDQAKAAALAMLDKGEPYDPVPWFWSDQYDTKLQIAGLSQGASETVVRGTPDDPDFAVAYLEGGRLIALDAVNRPKDYMMARRLVPGVSPVDRSRLADPAISLKDAIQEPSLAQ